MNSLISLIFGYIVLGYIVFTQGYSEKIAFLIVLVSVVGVFQICNELKFAKLMGMSDSAFKKAYGKPLKIDTMFLRFSGKNPKGFLTSHGKEHRAYIYHYEEFIALSLNGYVKILNPEELIPCKDGPMRADLMIYIGDKYYFFYTMSDIINKMKSAS